MSRFSWFAVWTLMLASPAFAQRDAMTELYGEAVHRYFSGDLAGAEQALTTVVGSGSQDPRAHYFLGLTREFLGQSGDADFQAGARLEIEGRQIGRAHV